MPCFHNYNSLHLKMLVGVLHKRRYVAALCILFVKRQLLSQQQSEIYRMLPLFVKYRGQIFVVQC